MYFYLVFSMDLELRFLCPTSSTPTLAGMTFNPIPPSHRRTKISLRSIFVSPPLGRDGATNASPLRGLVDE